MSLADETDFPFIIFQLSFFSETKQLGGPGEVFGIIVVKEFQK
jgi:hypothetical protein